MPSNLAAQVLLRIGYVFLHVQETERVVKVAIQVAMPAQEGLFLTLSEKLEPQSMKRPLGNFLNVLRKRTEVKPDVSALLERYLNSRNAFVHNLSELPGWSLKSPKGISAASNFLSQLLNDSKDVRILFAGLLHAYKVQAEIPTSPEEDAMFSHELEKYEKPIFQRKWIINDV